MNHLEFLDGGLKIKTEVMELEELNYSDDITEYPLIKKEIKLEPVEEEPEELHHSVDVKEELLIGDRTDTYTGKRLFQCKSCNYKSSLKANLKRHILTHTGEKPFKCNLCSYASNHKKCLINHLRIHSVGNKLECEFCDFKCYVRTSMTLHVRQHTEKRRFKCEICPCKFFKRVQLENHIMVTHVGENLFDDYRCSYDSCKSKYYLTSRFFTGAKPFECNICQFKTYHKSCLTMHLGTHSTDL